MDLMDKIFGGLLILLAIALTLCGVALLIVVLKWAGLI